MFLWLCRTAACDVTITQKVAERLGVMKRCPTMHGGPVVRAMFAAMVTAPEKCL